MRIDYKEIWDFMAQFPSCDLCDITLRIGEKSVHNIPHNIVRDIRQDTAYDSTLLEVLFTEREVLWEPKATRNVRTYLVKLNILWHGYAKMMEIFKKSDTPAQYLYADILNHFLKRTEAHKEHVEKDGLTVREVGRFRCGSIPFFLFFIEHPQTRKYDKREGFRKLNYMVKKLLLDMRRDFYHIESGPHWEVQKKQKADLPPVKKTQKGLSVGKENGANPLPRG